MLNSLTGLDSTSTPNLTFKLEVPSHRVAFTLLSLSPYQGLSYPPFSPFVPPICLGDNNLSGKFMFRPVILRPGSLEEL